MTESPYTHWLSIARTVVLALHGEKALPPGIEFKAADAAWHADSPSEALAAMRLVFEEA